ncbi:P-loop containing nucleoside triphosphate hydrolase protein [Pseudomassariella vexata]|uniref:p-loop containing nucleoside triphosphate hydrolase protein n=1 Tax=Pseudomassariella vexata TaxID=1141098 RepID=A0A1Y2DMY6_9PEZI|nr:P-loop containing nucleoside triphosphate hydrolase protein [Pseudomassariella vexata]ORY60607.1 P-loop containing nucleoside triphosphate hydrolase protein [Pseudomassariella vexata]
MAASFRQAATSASSSFVARPTFEVSSSIVRSYFLGHHAGALASMRQKLSNISLIIECRDSRVPLTSTNPLLESALAGRDRIIVYSKADLSFPPSGSRHKQKQEELLRKWHMERRGMGVGVVGDASGIGTTEVVFTDERQPKTIQRLLDAMKDRACAIDSLTGMRALVVGMPNAGKSTLLNAMRRVGMRMGKAAKTGAEPGVTRKLSTPVRVIPEDTAAGIDSGVFVTDTPGVFVPYVGDLDSMLKLSLVGCVKDGVVSTETIADYLLFHMNLRDPSLYKEFCPPTNNIFEFLDAVAIRTGKLQKGGAPAQELAANWVIQQWRKGNLGRFSLDEVTEETLQNWAKMGQAAGVGEQQTSLSQARKKEKEVRKARNLAKREASGA